jgi:hypothetical protein
MTNKIIYETSKEGNGVFNVKIFDDGTVDTTDDDNMNLNVFDNVNDAINWHYKQYRLIKNREANSHENIVYHLMPFHNYDMPIIVDSQWNIISAVWDNTEPKGVTR